MRANKKKKSNWQKSKKASHMYNQQNNARNKGKPKVRTVLIVILDIIIVCVPIGAYLRICEFLPPSNNQILAGIIGYVGLISSFVVAIGVGNLLMSILPKRLSRGVTLITLLSGSVVCALSLWLLTIV